ncbi:phage tail assembly protein T [Pseudomonas urmiensis]|uniref:phage tail assembly protein T n=1 Tax=Pseudomonas urmiensis TaxID=2745493 RepID=UPI003F685093
MAQAQEALSLREFHSWVKFRNRRGSFHIGMRVERSAALLASIIANQGRDRTRRPEPFVPADFAPHEDRRVTSLEQAMEQWV